MMNTGTIDTTAIDGIEIVALGQPVRDGVRRGSKDRARRTIVSRKVGFRRTTMSTMIAIVNGIVCAFAAHNRIKIGQVKKAARKRNCKRVGGIEAEEIHSWYATRGNICAHIHFGEG